MEGWEIALLVIAIMIAARSLASMMRERHDKIVEQVQQQVDQYQEYIRENPPASSPGTKSAAENEAA